ncbi:DUF726-domain-containing protein [Hypoxylon sp. NC1633]|nr:DUF726-domain-containing protein [Hypoxylon sp. NC1633]
MARNYNPSFRGRPQKRPELDLSVLLDESQKHHLIQLISSIADEMKTDLCNNFDELTPANVTPGQGIEPLKSAESAATLYGKTETDLLRSSLTEMKGEALAVFQKWRNNMEKRMQDITVKRGGNSGNVVNRPAYGGSFGIARGGGPPAPKDEPVGQDGLNYKQAVHHPSILTSFQQCDREKRALMLHAMLLILVGLDSYSVYSRILLLKLCTSLRVPMHVLTNDELRLSSGLQGIVEGVTAEEIAKRRNEEGKVSRRWKPGLTRGKTSFNGNGPLAPSHISAGIGIVFRTVGLNYSVTARLLGNMNESTVAIGSLFGLYGARPGAKSMALYSKDIQDFAMIPVHGPKITDPRDLPINDRRMRVTIGITGLHASNEDVFESWYPLGDKTELYALRWELDTISKMGNSMETLFKGQAWGVAKKELPEMTVFDRLTKSVWPFTLFQSSKNIDYFWGIGTLRADKTGVVLADLLLNKLQGERPVTLIGYGLGARVIYSCLMALVEKKGFGLVENAVLIGAPCPTEVRCWAAMKSVVSGRLVNVFSRTDYILGFLYRNGNWLNGVAGLQEISGVPNVQNHDCSLLATHQLRYRNLIGGILKALYWENIDFAQVNRQDQKFTAQIRDEQKIDEARDPKHTPKPQWNTVTVE